MGQLATTTTSLPEPRRDMGSLQCRPLPPGYTMGPLATGDISEIHSLAVSSIGCKLASLATFHRVLRLHPGLTYVIRKDSEPRLRGFFALLLLSAKGRAAATLDKFSGANPSPHHLASRESAGAALYSWVSVAERLAAFAVPLIMKNLQERALGHLDIYSRPGTEAGRRIMSNLGFSAVLPHQTGEVGELLVYRRRDSADRREAA